MSETTPPEDPARPVDVRGPAAEMPRTTQPEIAREMPPVNDLEAAKYQFPSMHPEGRKFVLIAAAITLILWFVVDWDILGWLMAGLTVWVFAFFRDPQRVTPLDSDLIVSPADGLVSHVIEVPVPRELGGPDGLSGERFTRISVFMSVFDVHVNRSPIAGTVRRVVYVPGKFVNAELDKASEHNERQYFIVERGDGVRVGFTQIAGLVARRIVRFVAEGERVAAGQRIGLIRFGSRVDVFLPAGMVPAVAVGQRAVAGETVLARAGIGRAVAGARQ